MTLAEVSHLLQGQHSSALGLPQAMSTEISRCTAKLEELESQLHRVTAAQQARPEHAKESWQQAVQLVLARVERLQQAQLLTEDERFAVCARPTC